MKKKLVVIQEEISDCGACCLLSIIRYYGSDASLENIRYLSLTTSEGITAYNLIECARQYGFDAQGLKKDKLEINDLPCIAHLNINKSLSHFVVVYKLEDNKICLMDPAKGIVFMNIDEFYSKYTGNIIKLSPKNITIPQQGNLFYKLIRKILKIHTNKIIKIILLNILFIVLSIIYSFYIDIYNEISNKTFVITLFIIIALLKLESIYLIDKNIEDIDYSITKKLIPDFFEHIFKLPLKYIHMKSTGDILKRIDDIGLVKNIFSKVLITFILNVLIILSLFIVVVIINKMVFFIMLIMFVLYILIAILLNQNINNDINEVINYSTNYNSIVVDSLKGITSIYHSSSKKYFKDKIESHLNDYLITNKKINLKILKRNRLKEFILIIGELLINTIMIIKVSNNTLSIEFVVIINMLLNVFVNSLNEIYSVIPNIYYQKNIIRRINEFYDLKEEDNDNNTYIANGNIKIQNLTFSYNTLTNIINNKNILIRKGEKILLKGSSGCGKSTICRLLNKEYIDYTGKIFIGNIEISNIGINNIKNIITYASQTEKVFAGTIIENITLGLNVDKNLLNKIIKICRVDTIFCNKVFKLDTFLYGGGEDLSGGERQLIILARTLLRNKKIIILDEILSEVNVDLERNIIEDIFKYFKDKTIIYISHKDIAISGSRTIHM